MEPPGVYFGICGISKNLIQYFYADYPSHASYMERIWIFHGYMYEGPNAGRCLCSVVMVLADACVEVVVLAGACA